MTDCEKLRNKLAKSLPSRKWMVEELDDSFNQIATAAMKFKMAWHYLDEERAAKYESIIAQLNEPDPKMPEEDKSIVDGFWRRHGFSGFLADTPPEYDQALQRFDEQCSRRDARIQQARHDFIDILPELWS